MISAVALLIVIFAGYALLVRLLRTVAAFLNDGIDLAAALFFFLLIAPSLWIWERGRRPMWRTLTPQQTRELQAWLKQR